MIGVSDPAFLDVIAGALARLGARKALVVSSHDGLDELSTSGADARSSRSTAASCAPTTSRPRRSACRASAYEDVAGGGRSANADTARRIFAGESGPPRDLAVLNAGAAIYAAGRADGLESGVARGRGGDRRRRAPRGRWTRLVALTAKLAPT